MSVYFGIDVHVRSNNGAAMSNQLTLAFGEVDSQRILDGNNPQFHRKRQIRQIAEIISAFNLNLPSSIGLAQNARDLSREDYRCLSRNLASEG